MKSNSSAERLLMVHRELEIRVLKLTDQLNVAMHQRLVGEGKIKKLNEQLAINGHELAGTHDAAVEADLMESSLATLGQSGSPSKATLAAHTASMMSMSHGGAGASQANLSSYPSRRSLTTMGSTTSVGDPALVDEATRARIQHSIEAQALKALEEEQMGLTYKQVLRRIKGELTLLKKSAEDMRSAVDEYNEAMKAEELRLVQATQNRREAMSLWHEVQQIRQDSLAVWDQKLIGRSQVADATAKEREALELEITAALRARAREARRQAQIAAGLIPDDEDAKEDADAQEQPSEEMMEEMNAFDAFLRETKLEAGHLLLDRFVDMRSKSMDAEDASMHLQAKVIQLQEEIKDLLVERDAEKLRLAGAKGSSADTEEINLKIRKARTTTSKSQRFVVQTEEVLSGVSLGIKLMSARLEQVLGDVSQAASLPPVPATTGGSATKGALDHWGHFEALTQEVLNLGFEIPPEGQLKAYEVHARDAQTMMMASPGKVSDEGANEENDEDDDDEEEDGGGGGDQKDPEAEEALLDEGGDGASPNSKAQQSAIAKRVQEQAQAMARANIRIRFEDEMGDEDEDEEEVLQSRLTASRSAARKQPKVDRKYLKERAAAIERRANKALTSAGPGGGGRAGTDLPTITTTEPLKYVVEGEGYHTLG